MPTGLLPPSQRVLALLVRHGRTPLNNTGKMRAWEDPPLNRDGELDAQMAAQAIKQYDPKHIYSSDLLRDVQTAQIISKSLGNVPHEVNFAMRTANIGELSGSQEKQAIPFLTRWYEEPWLQAPSGESYQDFCNRMDAFFFPKLDLARDVESFRPTVFVAHGRNLARLHSYFTMTPPAQALMPFPGGIAAISAGDDGHDTFDFKSATEPILADK